MVRSWFWLLGVIVMVLDGSASSQPLQDNKRGNPELAVWLEVPAEVSAGKTIPMKLKVKNIGDHTIILPLGGHPAHDVIVTRRDGTEIWRWLYRRAVEDILERRPLLPGEEVAFEAEWKQRNNARKPVPPDTYLVRGVLTTTLGQQLETEPKPLIIVP